MKIAIIGATGYVGAPILGEALSRGHTVRALMRDKKKLPPAENLEAVEIDITDSEALAKAIAGYDVVVHAYAPPRSLSVADRIAQQTRGTESIIRAVKRAGTPRLVAVGGAGTAEVAPGVPLMESYFFPPQYEGGAKSTAVVKDLLKRENEFDWVFISPPNFLEEGPRTGKYRTGKDNLIVDLSNGSSHMSVADYAVAFVDEIEKPRHFRERFTVGT
ncbi:NAD(P)H-binding protein [Desulfovibrio sp.]|uniref:NAD(P)-dependent oxidoreductase n=1 Tax=Desulfovibrio sp. TaxID=885 RepID=UPI0023C78D43|nr:NAD(P)H-binding protein [Desulfovibrio sp.]MDE7240789.1 NAD(P)H-binding protein [Desulfovibrio sp.]